MAALSRLLVYPAVGVVVLAPLAGIAWWCVALGGWDLPDVAARLERESKRRAALDRQMGPSVAAAEEKARVTEELIAGRLTLSEAAARFQRVNAARAAAGGGISSPALDEEALWANVITWVKVTLGEDPARAAVVVPALEAEFRSCFGHAPPSP